MSEGKTLGNQLQILSGFPFPSTDFTSEREGEPLIRIRDLQQQNPETYFSGDYDSSFLVSRGDVLVGMDGDFNAVKWQGPQALLNQRVCKITTKDPAVLNQDFLYHSLQPHLNNIHKGTAQTTVRHLSTKDLYGIDAELPPLPEQKKIAEILSGIDKMISAKSIRHEKRKTTAHLILDSVLANAELRQAPLSNIALLERGKFSHRPRNDPDYYGGEYPFIQTGDIPKTGIRISEHKQTLNRKGLEVSRQFPSGTIVITIAATIGEVGILSYPACFPDSLVGITPNTEECDTVFLHYSLRRLKDKLLQMAPQSAQSNLNLEILGKLDVPLPPLYEQRKFAQMICCEDERATAEVIGIRKLHDMKAAVASDLLSGRKRVSDARVLEGVGV